MDPLGQRGWKEMIRVSFIRVSDVQKLKHGEHFNNKNRNQLHKSEKTSFLFLLKIDFYNLESVHGHNLFRAQFGSIYQY